MKTFTFMNMQNCLLLTFTMKINYNNVGPYTAEHDLRGVSVEIKLRV